MLDFSLVPGKCWEILSLTCSNFSQRLNSGRVGPGIHSGAVFFELNHQLHTVAGAGGLYFNCEHASEAKLFASAQFNSQLREPSKSLDLWYDPKPTSSQYNPFIFP